MRAAVIAFVVLNACSSPSTADCLVVLQTASERIDERFDYHRQGCASDSDCTLAPEQVSCFSGCPSAVLAAQKDDALAEVAALDTSICNGTSCMISVGCNPVAAACISGFCRTVDGGVDAGVDAGIPDAGNADGG
jgi:hypothetical protein